MNAKQRDFLTGKIEMVYQRQLKDLVNQEPEEPMLNNYLVAAIIAGTIEYQEPKKTKDGIKKFVLSMGKDLDLLPQETRRNYRYSYNSNDAKERLYLSVPADLIFVLPKEYAVELKKYQDTMNDLEDRKKKLFNQKESLLMKVNLGGDAMLQPLIDEIDSSGPLSIGTMQLALVQ